MSNIPLLTEALIELIVRHPIVKTEFALLGPESGPVACCNRGGKPRKRVLKATEINTIKELIVRMDNTRRARLFSIASIPLPIRVLYRDSTENEAKEVVLE